MEISIKTLVEGIGGELGHATTSFMVFVAMGEKGPESLPPMKGGDPEADKRRAMRREVLKRIKDLLGIVTAER